MILWANGGCPMTMNLDRNGKNGLGNTTLWANGGRTMTMNLDRNGKNGLGDTIPWANGGRTNPERPTAALPRDAARDELGMAIRATRMISLMVFITFSHHNLDPPAP